VRQPSNQPVIGPPEGGYPALEDVACEEACIAVAMTRPDLVDALGALQPSDFTHEFRSVAWSVCVELRNQGGKVSVLTVASVMHGDVAGYRAALNEIALSAPRDEAAARACADRVRDLALRRKLVTVFDTCIHNVGLDEVENPPAAIMAEAIDHLSGMVADTMPGGEGSAAADLDRILERAQSTKDDRTLKVMSGLSDWDSMIGGFRAGELHIIGARPGMGKTIVGANVAVNAAEAGHGALYFSMEVNREQLATRVLCDMVHRGGHELWTRTLRSGDIPRNLMNPLIEARYRLEELPFLIDGTRGLTLAEIGARARAARRDLRRTGKDLSLIVVDYMTLIQPADRYKGNKVAEVTELSRGLKILAGEMDLPVVALCQLNRNTDNRNNADNRPRLSDLRESGSIEQDADSVTLLFREEYYVQQKRPALKGGDAYALWEAQYVEVRDRLEMIVAKNREGETGTLETRVIARCSAVRDA